MATTFAPSSFLRIKKFFQLLILFAVLFWNTGGFAETGNDDPLPNWNETPVKQHIIEFVQAVTDKSNPAYVAPVDRIATFDNDGTLWVEQPMYTQVLFAFDSLAKLARKNPQLKTQKPYSYVFNKQFNQLNRNDLTQILALTQSGISVEQYLHQVNDWLATTKDKHFQQPYTQLTYVPMLEVMNFLRQHDFKIYIVSGSSQDFIRAFAQRVYGLPPERIIGSTNKTQYQYHRPQAVLIKLPQTLLISDLEGKPEAIDLFIGKKPIIAFGNSVGDAQMLEWTQSHPGKTLMLLVHHDDAKREYAYDTDSKVGTFSTALMNEAKTNHWDVISMKNDWKRIFDFEEANSLRSEPSQQNQEITPGDSRLEPAY